MQTIINVRIYDFKDYYEAGYVIFNSKIIEVGHMEDYQHREGDVLDGKGMLVLPGLINGHTHLYSALSRGISLEFNPNNFQEILDQLWWKLDAKHTLESIYYSGLIGGLEALNHGVTTIIDHHASGIDITGSLEKLSTAVSDQVGIRGVYCFETSDRFDIKDCILENLSFANNHQGPMKASLFGMHASMSLSDNSLIKIKEAIGDRPIHIHVAESYMDESLCLKNHQMKVIARLDHFGLLNSGSLLAHCIYIDEEEAVIVANNACKIVVNPTSNMNNGVGLPDVHFFKNSDIDVLIGNDGIASGITTEWQNYYYAMHLKYHSPTGMSMGLLEEAINATYDYASSLLNVKLGKISPDYEADLVMVPYQNPTPINGNNAFSHLFFGLFDGFKPCHVFVSGNQLVKDYQSHLEEKLIYEEAKQATEALWQRIKEV